MNIKKMIMSAIAGASMLVAFVGTGSAAQVDVNVEGASAQYLFWSANGAGILANQGCTGIQVATFNSKNSITKATCGSDTVYYRVASKASYDGPSALMGDDHYAAAGASNEKCSAGDPGDPGAALENGVPLRGYYRKMVDENSCTWGTLASPGTCTAIKCQRVTLGVSDVATESFTQSSHGALLGPLGGAQTDRVFSGWSMDPAKYASYNPVVVPFAFFANTSVKKCVDATPTMYNSCSSSSNQQTIANLPRIMAVQIFSGQVYDWTDFGGEFVPNVPVVACLRHAGSGTAATLDYAVMNGPWGAQMASAQSTGGPTIYFNDGSGDEVNCIKGSGAWAGTGAIGYADADQATSATMVRLTYNGESASRANIRTGRYDFFTNEWVYENKLAPNYSVTHPHVTAMMAYAANPANIPDAGAFGSDKRLWWATQAEMNFDKTTDQNYPGIVGCEAGSCQQP
jgi:hypothetical protein